MRQKKKIDKKFRCDITDIGNQVIILLEYLSKKKQENPLLRLSYDVNETRKDDIRNNLNVTYRT